MVKKRIHIIGGGLAGLSAAVSLSKRADCKVIIYEGSPAFGGRARSFYDATLDRLIDNGNHLILSGNDAVFEYLRLINADKTLTGSGEPLFPFVDLEERKRWDLSLSKGTIPWWLFSSKNTIPDFHLSELMYLWKLIRAKPTQTVADCLGGGQFARRLLQPFAISALNTACELGSATLLGSVVKQSLMKGGNACIPYFPHEGLSETFVKPALSLIELQGGITQTKSRLSALHVQDNRLHDFVINDEMIEVGESDYVILALSPQAAEPILINVFPEIKIPNQFESILNLHYAVDPQLKVRGNIAKAKFIGIIGGISEWIFIKDGVVSITISAANRYIGYNQENLVTLIWQEILDVLNPVLETPLDFEVPAHRLLWEKRASFVATEEQERRRPSTYTPCNNLFLAGDWISTGLPATIEGAIRSGFSAAQAIFET